MNWVNNTIMLSSRDDLARTQRSSIVNFLKIVVMNSWSYKGL